MGKLIILLSFISESFDIVNIPNYEYFVNKLVTNTIKVNIQLSIIDELK